MLRDVKHTVTDGLLGFATATGDGKSLKIGVSPCLDTPIIITRDMDATKIKDRLGLSPLADAVMDSVQFGASRIYCLRSPPLRRASWESFLRPATAAAPSPSTALRRTPSPWWLSSPRKDSSTPPPL